MTEMIEMKIWTEARICPTCRQPEGPRRHPSDDGPLCPECWQILPATPETKIPAPCPWCEYGSMH